MTFDEIVEVLRREDVRNIQPKFRTQIRPWWETTRYCCPDCYAPIPRWHRGQDARCQRCRRSQANLPVNYQR